MELTPLILSADDFGLTDGVTRTITQMLTAGQLTSTSVMVAGEDTLARTRRWGSQVAGRAGVHLQLTGGAPVLSRAQVPSLWGAEDTFLPRAAFGAVDLEDLHREWSAQMRRAVEALGAPVTHLDSHHGVHRTPAFAPVVEALAREYGCAVRSPWGDLRGAPLCLSSWSGSGEGVEALRTALRAASVQAPAAIEVVCHPGVDDADLRAVSSWTSVREVDRDALMELVRDEWLAENGFRLAGPADL